MEIKQDTIFSDKHLNVNKIIYGNINTIGISYKQQKVIILPYTRNAQDVIEQVGILKEFNPLRTYNYAETLITETEEDFDDNALDCAIRGLEEETGYKVIDETRWLYLGKLNISKIIDLPHECYAVDVTGIQKGTKKANNELEEMSNFNLVPLFQITMSNDSYVLSLIMKLFIKKYGKTFIINQQNNY